MSDKIRIVGSFPDDVVDKVHAFTVGLGTVESVSVLRDGIEAFPQPEAPAPGAEEGTA
jgi:hypothetical protein